MRRFLFRVVDKRTGEVLEIDTVQSYLSRLHRRCVGFAMVAGREVKQWQMCTLTYPPNVAWSKNHVKEFVRLLYRHNPNLPRVYAWVAELQLRGALHYHIVLPDGFVDWADAWKIWEGVIGACGRVDFSRPAAKQGKGSGVALYLSGYVSKMEQKIGHFPRGARKYGFGIKGLSEGARLVVRRDALPSWVRVATSKKDLPKRAKVGGGFVNGEVKLESPYKVLGFRRVLWRED